MPDSNFIRIIARGSGSALALTSANLSGHCSSVCIEDFKNLWDHCAYVYDGGVLPSGRAGSTIVDLTQQGKYKIVRPGRYTFTFFTEDFALWIILTAPFFLFIILKSYLFGKLIFLIRQVLDLVLINLSRLKVSNLATESLVSENVQFSH